MAIYDTIENSAAIKALQAAWEAEAAKGDNADRELLNSYHNAAQEIRIQNGYFANDDGSVYTVIGAGSTGATTETATAATNDAGGTVTTSALNLSALNIDGDKVLSYAGYALCGLIVLSVLDNLGGRK